MNNFTFYSPTLFAFGDGEAKNTGALVQRFGGTKVLLVYGGGSVKRNGAYDTVTASLKEAGIAWAELTGIQPNPRSGKVYEGIELARKEGCDFLLALGGGSVSRGGTVPGGGAGAGGAGCVADPGCILFDPAASQLLLQGVADGDNRSVFLWRELLNKGGYLSLAVL